MTTDLAPLLARARTFYMGKEHVETVRARFVALDQGMPLEKYLPNMAEELYLVWKGPGSWAIMSGPGYGHSCFEKDTGLWVIEPMPSARTEEFIAATRYPLSWAWRMARNMVDGKPLDWPYVEHTTKEERLVEQSLIVTLDKLSSVT